MKEKRNLHPRKPTNQQGEKPRQRDLKVAKKSTAAGLRRAKQNESCTDHLHHHPRQPEMLRWGLGTETEALEVSSGKKTRVGCVETA